MHRDDAAFLRKSPAGGREAGEEALVVRDEKERAGSLGERVLQALYAGEVKVVRGLVHDDEVRALLDSAREEYLADFAGARRR